MRLALLALLVIALPAWADQPPASAPASAPTSLPTTTSCLEFAPHAGLLAATIRELRLLSEGQEVPLTEVKLLGLATIDSHALARLLLDHQAAPRQLTMETAAVMLYRLAGTRLFAKIQPSLKTTPTGAVLEITLTEYPSVKRVVVDGAEAMTAHQVLEALLDGTTEPTAKEDEDEDVDVRFGGIRVEKGRGEPGLSAVGRGRRRVGTRVRLPGIDIQVTERTDETPAGLAACPPPVPPKEWVTHLDGAEVRPGIFVGGLTPALSRVVRLFFDAGYYMADLSASLDPDGTLRVHAREGKIAHVELRGVPSPLVEDTQREFGLHPGDTFDAADVKAGVSRVQDYFPFLSVIEANRTTRELPALYEERTPEGRIVVKPVERPCADRAVKGGLPEELAAFFEEAHRENQALLTQLDGVRRAGEMLRARKLPASDADQQWAALEARAFALRVKAKAIHDEQARRLAALRKKLLNDAKARDEAQERIDKIRNDQNLVAGQLGALETARRDSSVTPGQQDATAMQVGALRAEQNLLDLEARIAGMDHDEDTDSDHTGDPCRDLRYSQILDKDLVMHFRPTDLLQTSIDWTDILRHTQVTGFSPGLIATVRLWDQNNRVHGALDLAGSVSFSRGNRPGATNGFLAELAALERTELAMGGKLQLPALGIAELGAQLHSLDDTADRWRMSRVDSYLYSMLANRPESEYFRRTGVTAFLTEHLFDQLTLGAEYRFDRYNSLAPLADLPTLFNSDEPGFANPAIVEGEMGSLLLRLEWSSEKTRPYRVGTIWRHPETSLIDQPNELAAHSKLRTVNTVELARRDLGSDAGLTFTKYVSDTLLYLARSADTGLGLRFRVAGGSNLPAQKDEALGGWSALRGYAFKELTGDVSLLGTVEARMDWFSLFVDVGAVLDTAKAEWTMPPPGVGAKLNLGKDVELAFAWRTDDKAELLPAARLLFRRAF